ncbi:MAG TPA: hypothetical protein VMV61_12640 [Patescibacteria group bacterium]|nr:hypothetical protein [Patescibacteria group bacterium]
MDGVTLYIVFAAVLLGTAAALLRHPREEKARRGPRSEQAEEFFPIHSRYFPQVRRMLSPEDVTYMSDRASPALFRRWKQSLQHAGSLYLEGLREDFHRLNRLARVLALRSPKLRPKQELELAWLNLRFEMLYGIVRCRLWLGRPAEQYLAKMAGLIGSLGRQLEQTSLGLTVRPGALTP